MIEKKYDDIPDLTTPWEGYADQCVEKLIKDEWKKKAGFIYKKPSTSTDCGYLFGFPDREEFAKWIVGDSSIKPLFIVAMPYEDQIAEI